MKSWIEKYNIEMYSMHNEGKSIIAETFIKTMKNKMYEYMTSISKMCVLINQMIQLTNIIIYTIAQLK